MTVDVTLTCFLDHMVTERKELKIQAHLNIYSLENQEMEQF